MNENSDGIGASLGTGWNYRAREDREAPTWRAISVKGAVGTQRESLYPLGVGPACSNARTTLQTTELRSAAEPVHCPSKCCGTPDQLYRRTVRHVYEPRELDIDLVGAESLELDEVDVGEHQVERGVVHHRRYVPGARSGLAQDSRWSCRVKAVGVVWIANRAHVGDPRPMTDDDLDEAARRNVRALHDQLVQVTVLLVDWEPGLDFPRNRASGFVIKRNGRYFVISAGHALRRGKWSLELDPFRDGKHQSLLVPLRSTWGILKHVDLEAGEARSVDFAWADIDVERLRADVRKDERLQGLPVTIPEYRGSLDRRPSGDDVYTYVALNQAVGEEHPFSKILERKASHEIGMEYVDDAADHDAYVFRLGRDHQGHKYYKGASGAPIADSEGIIVSVVLGGSEERHELYGARLADFEHLIGAAE